MRVLVTRAEPNATRTARTLETLGHQPIVMPLSRVERDASVAAAGLAETSCAIIVTSAEALRTLEELEGSLTPFLQRRLYAVGRATGAAAEALGFRDIVIGDGDGRALAARIGKDTVNDPSPMGTPLLYLAGVPRAGGLEEELKALGISVDIRECYRMLPEEPDMNRQIEALVTQRPEAVLCYSAESVQRLLELPLLRNDRSVLQDAIFCCISEVVGDTLRPHFPDRVRVAERPGEPALLALIPD